MFRKKFIDQLKEKYKKGGTSTNVPDPPTDWSALWDYTKRGVQKTGDWLGSAGQSLYNTGSDVYNALTAEPRPLTEEEKSLSYLSDIKGTSVYDKLQKLSDSKKKRLYREYTDVLESTEGFKDMSFKDKVSTFKNLKVKSIKNLQEKAGITKDELRNVIYDKTGYHDMAGWEKVLMKGALSSKGFKRGGIAYRNGGTQLEGGVMLPIPNSNAVEFKGKTHEEGGIMLDEKTEVENNETMDKVIMKKGDKKDYFFSSYLKKDGKSFADMHKELLKNNGTQKEINMLAKMQEKAAKRSPKQIARLGGVVKYATGGLDEDDRIWMDVLGNEIKFSDINKDGIYFVKDKNGVVTKKIRTAGKFLTNKDLTDNTPINDTPTDNTTPDNTPTNNTTPAKIPFTNKEEGNAFRAWINETYPDYAKEIDLDKKGGYNNSYIKKAWDKYGETYINKDIEIPEEVESGTYTDEEGNIYERGRTGEWRVRWNKATAEGLPEFGEVPQDLTGWETLQEGFDPSASGALTKLKETPSEEKIDLTDDQQALWDKIQGRAERRGDIPTIAGIAGALQLGPAAYSLFHKQPPAEQAQYTRGFTNPIVAQMAKAPTLDRVNYNAERANNAAQMREIGNYIETSGGGPANIINKMMAYGKKQQGDMLIASAESKANTAISNQEAQMKNAVTLSNFQRAQQASQVNAQLQAQETARMDQINLANAAARQAVKDDEEFQKYQGVNTLGTNLAGLAGDVMSYTASERMARVMGSEGIYDRDVFRDIAMKEIKKTGIPGICGGTSGIPCTDDMINKFITSQNKDKE